MPAVPPSAEHDGEDVLVALARVVAALVQETDRSGSPRDEHRHALGAVAHETLETPSPPHHVGAIAQRLGPRTPCAH